MVRQSIPRCRDLTLTLPILIDLVNQHPTHLQASGSDRVKETHHGETKHPEMWRFNPNITNPHSSYQHPTHLQASGSDRVKETHHGETKHPEMWRFNPNITNPHRSYQHPTHLQASGSDRVKGNAPW